MPVTGLSGAVFRNAALSLVLAFSGASAAPADIPAATNDFTSASSQNFAHAKTPKRRGKAPRAPGPYQGGPKAWLYMNAETGDVLDQFNATREIEPASLAKEMTAIVVFDALRSNKLRAQQRLPLADAGAVERQGAVTLRRKTGIAVGTFLSVDSLLAATAVASAADATITLAKGVCGDEACFTELMNQKVREILAVQEGARSSTYFTNSHGMPGNRTTALDLAKIHRYMIKNYPNESKYFSQTSYTIQGRDYPGHNKLLIEYECKNRLHIPYKCMEVSKTGFFRAAGFGIVGSASWNGYRVIGVQMGHVSSAQRNAALANGLDLHFRQLEQSGAPKTPSARWHFPSLPSNPPVEPEPDPTPDEEISRAPAVLPGRGYDQMAAKP